jgi:hypothetical protein
VSAVHCHVLWLSGDPWDLEQSMFSLLTQVHAPQAVSVQTSADGEPLARQCLHRLGPLAPETNCALTSEGTPLLGSEDAAVCIWIAGVIATPDHLARCVGGLQAIAPAVVAPMRRMEVQRQPSGPPFVRRKRWTSTARHPSWPEIGQDPAFLARCLVSRAVAPPWLPRTLDDHQRWGAELWGKARPVKIAGPPSIDLPDLRPPGSRTRARDVLADLRYQLPRGLERAAPLTFHRLRSLWRRSRGLVEPGTD